MLLTEARVTNFRSIEDSGAVAIDAYVTSLVGQNESGKTAFLHALHKAKSTEAGVGFDITEDYPRKDLLDYEIAHESSPAVVARLTYEVESFEIDEINEWLGHRLLEKLEVTVSHKYGGTSSVTFADPERSHAEWLLGSLNLSSDAKEAISGAESIKDIIDAAESSDLTSSDQSEIDALKAKFPDPPSSWKRLMHALWRTQIKPRIPVFLYFDDYRILPGKTDLVGLQERVIAEDLTDRDKGTLRLLDIASLTPQKLSEPGGYEREKARLEATGNKISRKVFGFWRQNQDLKVQFDVSDDPEDTPPYDRGKNLYIRIENRRHEVTVPFDQRSKGFIWFFSFIAWFDSIREEIDDNRRLILLLDEPGLSLHALAQGDFLRYIDELSEEHQIIYTTHSPFMVESRRLDRVRTVEDKGEAGTVVTGDLSGSDPKTLFPLQAALGYSIAQNLFVSDRNLLVEGIADLAFLQAADELLRESGRQGLREDVTITPVGGIGKVSAFASLFGANDLSLTVLHDYEGHEDQQLAHLVREKILPKNGVLHYADFREPGGSTAPTDVEDMLNDGTYLRYFNKAFSNRLAAPIKVNDLPKGSRLVERISRYLAQNGITLKASGGYNHYLPAKAFAASPPKLSAAELERFESLFKAVNQTFAQRD